VLAVTFIAHGQGIIEATEREMIMSKVMANARRILNLDAAQKTCAREDPGTLSDWCLKDIGLTRFTRDFDAAKPFWMA
jgi:uncharacterized protein YjiS (DUF1127 family)